MYTYIHIPIYTYICIMAYIYIHRERYTNIHIYIYTHTYSSRQKPSRSGPRASVQNETTFEYTF